jgi:hypothetical protein
MSKYKLVGYNGNTFDGVVQRTSDNAFIPFDPDNRDAEEFALWLKSGNVPEPAEENSTVDAQWIADTIAKLLPNA